jgi:hypothetical protein
MLYYTFRHHEVLIVANQDPFERSLMAQPAYRRLLGAGLILVTLWIAILWAVALA